MMADMMRVWIYAGVCNVWKTVKLKKKRGGGLHTGFRHLLNSDGLGMIFPVRVKTGWKFIQVHDKTKYICIICPIVNENHILSLISKLTFHVFFRFRVNPKLAIPNLLNTMDQVSLYKNSLNKWIDWQPDLISLAISIFLRCQHQGSQKRHGLKIFSLFLETNQPLSKPQPSRNGWTETETHCSVWGVSWGDRLGHCGSRSRTTA